MKFLLSPSDISSTSEPIDFEAVDLAEARTAAAGYIGEERYSRGITYDGIVGVLITLPNLTEWTLFPCPPQEPKAQEVIFFTCNDFTTIKSTTGQFTFRGTGEDALRAHKEDAISRIRRLKRQIAALDSVISGSAISDPKALY